MLAVPNRVAEAGREKAPQVDYLSGVASLDVGACCTDGGGLDRCAVPWPLPPWRQMTLLPAARLATCQAPEPPAIVSALLKWMESSRRNLPWRQHRDPYAVWVSEIMLQQTRAETVAPYFERWMLRFPDIRSLATAPLEDVLKAWEGLGYYTRARNLHRAALQVVVQNEGHLPQDSRRLMALPGIGRYTAGAILSLAFGLPEPALDGNAKRVLCRLYDIEGSTADAGTQALLWRLATALVVQAPTGRAGDLNEALIELGALVCSPRKPNCGRCPLCTVCIAYGRGLQTERPVKPSRRTPPHFPAVAGVIRDREGRLLLVQRNARGLLGGLWGFPGGVAGDQDSLTDSLETAVANLVGINIAVKEALLSFRHAYSHFSITLHAYCCEMSGGVPRPINCARVLWAQPDEIDRYPFPVTDLKIMRFLEREHLID
jgi:A/G-specific adenine glycosylase